MNFLGVVSVACLGFMSVQAFQIAPTRSSLTVGALATNTRKQSTSALFVENENESIFEEVKPLSRRSVLSNTANSLLVSTLASVITADGASATVGTLPEFSDTNAVLQGLTVDVADKSQLDDMVAFLKDGFNCKLLRQRTVGSVTDVWLGFGPEQMSIPETFELPVSSFANYGGHGSIHVRYDSQTTDAFYRRGQDAPGDNIAYVQIGVPEYRISQMVKNGGNIIDAYGIVNVVSPSGIPFRGIVGISPDPIMFIALNCENVKKTAEFYQQLGFVEQEYPFCRPNKGMGQIEPPQPKNSVYLAPSPNSIGVLLLKSKKRNVKPNPVLRSLNIVYQPSEGTVVQDGADLLKVVDPSAIPIAFEPISLFEKVEASTRVFVAPEEETS